MRVIIPAAGQATRFGGVRKELLPLSSETGDTPLRRAVQRAYDVLGADSVVVVSTPDLISLHARALVDAPVDFRIRSDRGEMWGSVALALTPEAGGLILPDTVWSARPVEVSAPIAFGVFPTDESERFSVLRGDTIATKQPGPPGYAWGCVLWSAATARDWMVARYDHYDDAFRAAMAEGYTAFSIEGYHDLGSFATYRRYLVTQ